MTSRHPLVPVARRLGERLRPLHWHTPSHVYNPLVYAWDGHRQYLEMAGGEPGRVLLMGMNPGPWGMAQTGVPFGNISSVRDWFGIDTRLGTPLPEPHPRYPVLGMQCHRDEGSGQRLWGWAARRLGTPQAFFRRFVIWNYCPLLFLADGRNMIPSRLSRDETGPLEAACDAALAEVVEVLQPAAAIGIGRYAQERLRRVVPDGLPVHYLLHPSPASPAANRHWIESAEETLAPWLPDAP